MKVYFFVCGLFLSLSLTGQAPAINFESGSFREAKAKAEAESKILFIDVYTTWCGPCKRLNAEVFSDQEVANYFNTNFINYKVDAEKGEGIPISRQYNVGAFPTLLFLDASGAEVYRMRGFRPAEPFLDESKTVIDPNHEPTIAERYANDKEYRKTLEEARKKQIRLSKILISNRKLDSLYQAYNNGNRKPDLIGEYLLERIHLEVPEESLLKEYQASISNKQPEWNSMHTAIIALELESTLEPSFEEILQFIQSEDSVSQRDHKIIVTNLEAVFEKDLVKIIESKNLETADILFKKQSKLLDLKDWSDDSKIKEIRNTKFKYYKETGNAEHYAILEKEVWNEFGSIQSSEDSIYRNNWALNYSEILLGYENLNIPDEDWKQLLNQARENNLLYEHPTTYAPIMLCLYKLNFQNETMQTMRKGMISGKKKDQDTKILFQLFTRIKKTG